MAFKVCGTPETLRVVVAGVNTTAPGPLIALQLAVRVPLGRASSNRVACSRASADRGKVWPPLSVTEGGRLGWPAGRIVIVVSSNRLYSESSAVRRSTYVPATSKPATVTGEE